MENKFTELLKQKIVILDGAMGTMLANNGLDITKNTERYSVTHPEVVEDIHYRYLLAGADIIYTNTFGASPLKLSTSELKEVIDSAIACAHRAVERAGHGLICYDMTALGELLEPMGKLTFDEAYSHYKELVLLAKDKVDMFVIETMSDIYELKTAVLAVKENTDLPLIASMSFDTSGRTFAGCSIEAMVATLSGLGVDALGLNCSLSPQEIAPLVDRLLAISDTPIFIKPNAGLPSMQDGRTCYMDTPKSWVSGMLGYVNKGINIIGGCCGTTSEYIAELSAKTSALKPTALPQKGLTLISSGTKCVIADQPRIIGERINPTGKKLMKEAILNHDLDFFKRQAIEQSEHGAEILDINMGLPNIDEREMMKIAVKAVQSVVDLPLQIDSSDVSAIESGLRYYNGKPILNSVNGDDDVLESILPLAKKYGACVVGLTLDRHGIPKTIAERLTIAKKIIAKASQYGIPKKDIIIDCLTLTLGAEQAQASMTLEAITSLKAQYGVKTMLGISNVSFGLPERQTINSAFLLMALAHGLDFAIINPNLENMEQSFLSYRLIAGHDDGGANFIAKFSSPISPTPTPTSHDISLSDCILSGLVKEANEATTNLLKDMNGLKLLDTVVIPALNTVGERYEKGAIFLPQLLMSSSVAKSVCALIKDSMPSNQIVKKDTIILATVLGDVHDIGKNIVKTVLENYGYNIIDLGKDVPIQTVVDSVIRYQPLAVGLSALMTTSVSNMRLTIEAIRASGVKVIICVGGAVLSESIASSIGADRYCKDPQQIVKYLESVQK